jgi:hypothetical protein
VSIAVLVAGCTRSNLSLSDGDDLAGPPDLAGAPYDLALAAVVLDLSLPAAPDLSAADLSSTTTPHDLAGSDLTTSTVGVSCGGLSCPGGCCLTQTNSPFCIAGGTTCPGVAVLCDGPEDCPSLQLCCGSQQGSSCQVAVCGINTARLCHTKADCGLLANCCPYMTTGFSYCSNQSCP